jgi:hypothetical protein
MKRALLLVALTGCATLSPAAAALHDLPPERVAACAYVGVVKGSSGWGGAAMSGVGEADAKNDALNRAALLGADSIVWMGESSGMGGGEAMLRAYRCGHP